MAPDPRQLRSQRFPLHAAVETGDYVRVRGLLEGAMASQVNRRYETSGQTPLHIAASEASQEMIQLLLEAGAAVDETDCVKQTALHYSMTNPRQGVVETLLRAGADVNQRRMKDGWSPLFLAGIFGFTRKVESLLESGADVLLCDDRGLTVMDWVARYGLKTVQSQLKLAPRRVTEASGKKYVEAEVEDKLQVPVEFDEGINKLLAKLEIKRKARIAEHKNLLMKMEKEKVEEKKVIEKTESVEEKTEEPAVCGGEEEAAEKLTVATDSILQRQKRFLQEMEEKEDQVSSESERTPDSSRQVLTIPSNQSTTTSHIPPQKISNSLDDSKDYVDLDRKSSNDVLSNLVGQLSCDKKVPRKRNKINNSCDKVTINGSFKASIDALFEKTANSEAEDLAKTENGSIEDILQNSNSEDSGGGIPKIFPTNCNLETSTDKNNSINENLESIIPTTFEVTHIDRSDSVSSKDATLEEHHEAEISIEESRLSLDHKIGKTLELQTVQSEAEDENQEAVKESLPTEIKHEEAEKDEADFGNKSKEDQIPCIPEMIPDMRSDTNTTENQTPEEKKSCKGIKKKKSVERLESKPEKLSAQKKETDNDITEKTQISPTEVKEAGGDTKEGGGGVKPSTKRKKKKVPVKTEECKEIEKKSQDSEASKEPPALAKDTDCDNSINLAGNVSRKGDLIKKDKESDSNIQSPHTGRQVSTEPEEKPMDQAEEKGRLSVKSSPRSERRKEGNTDRVSTSKDTDTDTKTLRNVVTEDSNKKIETKSSALEESKEMQKQDTVKTEEISKTFDVTQESPKQGTENTEESSNGLDAIQEFLKHDIVKTEDNSNVPEVTEESKNQSTVKTEEISSAVDVTQESQIFTEKTEEISSAVGVTQESLKQDKVTTEETSKAVEVNQESPKKDTVKIEKNSNAVEVTQDSFKNDIEEKSNAVEVTKESPKPDTVKIEEISKTVEVSQALEEKVSRTNDVIEVVELQEKDVKNISDEEQRNAGDIMLETSSLGETPMTNIEGDSAGTNLEIKNNTNESDEESKPSEDEKNKSEVQSEVETLACEPSSSSSSPSVPSIESPEEMETKMVKVTEEKNSGTENDKHSLPSASSGETVKEAPNKVDAQQEVVLCIDDLVKNSNLPDQIEDADFNDKLKVFNNYRNFGAMYVGKKNFKKAEWAFKNGIKQSTSVEARSREQLKHLLTAEVEFRLSRARCLKCLGQKREAEGECRLVLSREPNQEASDLLSTL